MRRPLLTIAAFCSACTAAYTLFAWLHAVQSGSHEYWLLVAHYTKGGKSLGLWPTVPYWLVLALSIPLPVLWLLDRCTKRQTARSPLNSKGPSCPRQNP